MQYCSQSETSFYFIFKSLFIRTLKIIMNASQGRNDVSIFDFTNLYTAKETLAYSNTMFVSIRYLCSLCAAAGVQYVSGVAERLPGAGPGRGAGPARPGGGQSLRAVLAGGDGDRPGLPLGAGHGLAGEALGGGGEPGPRHRPPPHQGEGETVQSSAPNHAHQPQGKKTSQSAQNAINIKI